MVHQVGNDGGEVVRVDDDAGDPGIRGIEHGAQQHPRHGAAGAGAAHDVVKVNVQGFGLLHRFLDAQGVAQGAQGHGTSHRHAVGLMPVLEQLLADPVHLRVHVRVIVRIHKPHVRPQQVVQQLVALFFPDASFFQHQDAV